MKNNRFVPIEELKKLLKKSQDITLSISKYNQNHCKFCGDTKPKHGFYPLLAYTVAVGVYQTSGLCCNRCRYSDEEYLRIFGESKEVISE